MGIVFINSFLIIFNILIYFDYSSKSLGILGVIDFIIGLARLLVIVQITPDFVITTSVYHYEVWQAVLTFLLSCSVLVQYIIFNQYKIKRFI